MEPSPPLPGTPLSLLDHLTSQSPSSPASIRSKSPSSIPSSPSSLGFFLGSGVIEDDPIQDDPIESTYSGVGLWRSSSPVLQEVLLKEDTNQINYFDELRGSDLELPYHLGTPISPPVLLPRPVLQLLFKEDRTASYLRFRPYHLTLPPRQGYMPPLVVPVRAQGKVVEGTVYDGTSVATLNLFAPSTSHDGTSAAISNTSAAADRVIYPTSHHVPSSLESILHGQSSRPLAIPLHHLQKITDNFSDGRIIGQGGSGVVYKGVLQNGEIIAVKKIVSSLLPDLQRQFENEVYNLMKLKHSNIVRFLGYCYETRNECLEYNGKLVFAEMAERLLCLEYLPNGSLDKYITDESFGLDWRTRYKIIEGICYGLCHLHMENGNPIIHLDLKPANVLLDDCMVPQITDFGLSRLLDQQKTIYTNSRDGTLGYMAPEFLLGGTITPKSDIFSLGVIIIEIITGRRDYPDVSRTSSDGFINLVLNKWRNVLEKSSWFGSVGRDCQQIERCIQVGLICVNHDRTKRPPIAKIINMIKGLESINCDISIKAA